jgi:hypothetical protein
MGMDIHASLFVGRHQDDLNIVDAPYYTEYVDNHAEGYTYWADLFGYYWGVDDDSIADLKYRKTYIDNSSGYIGFVIGDSGSWDASELDWEDVTFSCLTCGS